MGEEPLTKFSAQTTLPVAVSGSRVGKDKNLNGRKLALCPLSSLFLEDNSVPSVFKSWDHLSSFHNSMVAIVLGFVGLEKLPSNLVAH